MNELIIQISSVLEVIEEISADVEKNNRFNLIPEFMNLMENIFPVVFLKNNELKIFDENEIIEMLNDIVNAYENNDAVLMTDVLRYGLNTKLREFMEAINSKESRLV